MQIVELVERELLVQLFADLPDSLSERFFPSLCLFGRIAVEATSIRDTMGTGLTAEAVADKARLNGVLLSTMGAHRVRACTHIDVDAAGVDFAVQVVASAVRSSAPFTIC